MSGKLQGTLHDSSLVIAVGLLSSLLVISASVVSLSLSLHTVGFLRVVQLIWNILFGVLIAVPHVSGLEKVSRSFGFVETWSARPDSSSRKRPLFSPHQMPAAFLLRLGRGTFLLYAGCSVFPHRDAASESRVVSYIAGFACILVGLLELITGCKGWQESRDLSNASAAPLIPSEQSARTKRKASKSSKASEA